MPPSISKEPNEYLEEPDPNWSVQSIPSESPGAQLWSFKASLNGAKGSESSVTELSLGVPRNYSKWFATVRPWTPWIAPRHGKAPFAPPQVAVACAFLRYDGLSLVLLAISGLDDVLTELKADDKGSVIARSRNDRESNGEAQVLASLGPSYECANAAVMYQARRIMTGELSASGHHSAQAEQSASKDVRAEWVENWYDSLTFCTWNALGQDLNEQKIYDALSDLKENDINITNLIIDDNWQTLDANGPTQFDMGWSGFEANPKGFPKGLKHTATKIRENYPNIKHITVWHAILGYWGAVSPHGKIAQTYKTKKVNKTGGGHITVVDEPDIGRMYRDFYDFLLDAGIDSVKTDAQFMLDEIADAPDRRRLITAYLDEWTIASLSHFSIRVISCMSQFPQNLFHTQLPMDKPPLMVRNSDDFFPDIAESHPYHIFCNAYNALLTSHLNTLPDWDMFQTSHPYASFHAAGRCVSGGPIYITDTPGKHNIELIRQMTAQNMSGKTVVLRPSVFGKTINPYNAYEEEHFLKVGTFTGGKGGTGILAVFNISQRALSEGVNLMSIPGTESGEEYAVQAFTTGEVRVLSGWHAVVTLQLEIRGWEILATTPVRAFTLAGSTGLQSSATKVAVLGLRGKMTGAAAVLGSKMTMQDNGRLHVLVKLKALGILGVFISDVEKRDLGEDFMIMIQGRAIPMHCASINMDESLLEVDTEKAWKEMGLQAGYGNELGMDIYVH